MASARVAGTAGVGVGASGTVLFSGGEWWDSLSQSLRETRAPAKRHGRPWWTSWWPCGCALRGAAGGEHQLRGATCGSGFIGQMPTNSVFPQKSVVPDGLHISA